MRGEISVEENSKSEAASDTPTHLDSPHEHPRTTHRSSREEHCSQESRAGTQTVIDRYLPEAQTCFFTLSLPNYSSSEILREKLLQAITSCKAIDTDFLVRDSVSSVLPTRLPLSPTTTLPPRDTNERRRRRQLLRSRTHNSSEQSHQESAIFSEETLSQVESTTTTTTRRQEADTSLLLQLEKSYESFSQSWM